MLCSLAIAKTSSESITTTTFMLSARRAACPTQLAGRPSKWRSWAVGRSAYSRDCMKSGTRSGQFCLILSSSSCKFSITQVLPEPGRPVSKMLRFPTLIASKTSFTTGRVNCFPAMSRSHVLPMADVLTNDVLTFSQDMVGTSIAPDLLMIVMRSSLVRRC